MIIGKRLGSLILSHCGKSFPSLNAPQYPFATSPIEQLITKNESALMFRSTNLNFKSELHSMYVYFIQPNCTPVTNNLSQHLYSIHGDNALAFTFYPHTVEGMEEGSYEQRKGIQISFKDVTSFMQIAPHSSQKAEFYRKYQDPQTNIRRLTVKDNPQQKWLNFHLSASSTKQNQTEQNFLWELDFPLKYPQYRVLLEYLKTNLTYISGTTLMLQKSKEQELNKVKNQPWTRKK